MNGTYYIEIAKSRSLYAESLEAEARAHKAIGDMDRAKLYDELAKSAKDCAESYWEMARNQEDDSHDQG